MAAIADWIMARGWAGEGGVVSCSALKVRYREVLRQAYAGVWFLHLDVDRDLVARRVAGRSDHFMPASLVDSQFEALEPLRPDEPGMAIDASSTPETIVGSAVERVSAAHASG